MAKKNNIYMIGFVFVLIVMLSLSNVSAYKRLCLTKGDVVPSKQKPIFTCTHDRCEICVTDTNYPTHPGFCNDVSGCNIWGPSDNSSLDTQPPVLTVNSPKENGVYSGRMVMFDLASNELSAFSFMNNNDQRSGWKSIMNNFGTAYKKELSLSDGLNDITIKATDKAGNIATISRKFYVDSKAPKIKGTSPTKGFANGKFNVQFTEQNPKTLTLYYGNSIKGMKTYNVPILTLCTLTKGVYTCEASVSVADYNSQSINYYFILEDIAGAKVTSKTVSLNVDTTPPVLTNPTTFYNQTGKYIQYSFAITEQNFKDVSVMDNADRRPRWTKICSSLKNGKCEKKVSYSKGFHSLDLIVHDQANNSISKHIEFTVV